MNNILSIFLWIVVGYGVGSILFGEITTKLFGIGDIRKIGSGNIGATNVLRSGHKLLAFFTLIGDFGKGFFVVLFTLYITDNINYSIISGLTCVIGHIYPFLRITKGGKGVATSLGVHLAMFPLLGGIAIMIWFLVALLTKRSSAAGLMLIAVPILGIYWQSYLVFLYDGYGWYYVSITIACLVIWRHKKNIHRLVTGKEERIFQKTKK